MKSIRSEPERKVTAVCSSRSHDNPGSAHTAGPENRRHSHRTGTKHQQTRSRRHRRHAQCVQATGHRLDQCAIREGQPVWKAFGPGRRKCNKFAEAAKSSAISSDFRIFAEDGVAIAATLAASARGGRHARYPVARTDHFDFMSHLHDFARIFMAERPWGKRKRRVARHGHIAAADAAAMYFDDHVVRPRLWVFDRLDPDRHVRPVEQRSSHRADPTLADHGQSNVILAASRGELVTPCISAPTRTRLWPPHSPGQQTRYVLTRCGSKLARQNRTVRSMP